ncbi:ribose-5-phosphate isomerase RpiA [Flavobacterium sp. MC2016-06]|jgi:ribose 5-phosphate isomerase A|uniref:ribose-5-phosphate isomerase RpiA n=1 Tax=Flavobacterium sp. MC2016-06 TaxID=2676308 RepID=UPI0012BAFC4C|nr:ribose-5-phosphate isomerase RpiA [Flavobacterium sp. MC2016-06]MBU3861445.1 ribose-5-phosphate isomerase RpiA [Flavobacterium sp. MC2016-06]
MAKDLEKEKKLAAKEAVKSIRDHMIIGLGTGSSAVYVIKEIGELVKNGLKIKAIPTSNATQELAASLNIPLIDINSVNTIDITIDGADEFTSDLILIKGGGGALLKEKIVASLTKEEIIIADSSKKVEAIGKFKVPIEVIPFASNYVLRQIELLKGIGQIRTNADQPFITDQGNYIIDADFGLISNPAALAEKLNGIEGIVGHGIFIDLASKVIMGNNDSILIFERKGASHKS